MSQRPGEQTTREQRPSRGADHSAQADQAADVRSRQLRPAPPACSPGGMIHAKGGRAETEGKQWSAVPPRLEENYARMRANNVVISSDLDPELRATLRDAAQDTIRAWLSTAGHEGRTILTDFLETPPRP